MAREDPPCLAAALDYCRRGWSALLLCPADHEGTSVAHQSKCKNPGKVPAGPFEAWQHCQTNRVSEGTLRLAWSKVPTANAGIALGPVSGLVGLDQDGQAGCVMLEEVSGGELPPTLAFATQAGGRRYLFQYPQGMDVPNRTFKAADGSEALRILSKGAQTVMPPSIGVHGAYSWLPGYGPGEVEPAPCPPWLIALAQSAKGQGPLLQTAGQGAQNSATREHVREVLEDGHDVVSRARAYLAACDPAVSGAGGHNQTFKIACKLVKGFALDTATALSLLLSDYNPRCQPPWTEKELAHKVQDAARSEGETGSMLHHYRHNGQPQTAPPPPVEQPTAPGGWLPPPPRKEKIITAQARSFAEVTPHAVRWLVPGYFPLGKVAILDGDPGLGKSTLLLDVAARITGAGNGYWVDGTAIAQGAVVILSAEDDPEDTIRPRLELAGADLHKVHFIDHIRQGDEPRPVEIPADLPLLEGVLRQTEASLLVVDPLMAFLAGVDANTDQSVRKCLYALSEMAKRRGCAIICQRHLNKGSSPKAMYRGGGSIAITAHARCAFLVAEDPDDPQRRLLAAVKVNRGAKPPTLRFSLDPVEVEIAGDKDTICRIGWCGISPYQADQLVGAPKSDEDRQEAEEAKSKLEVAKDILQDLLELGPVEMKAAKAECAAAGCSLRTTERAARELGLTVERSVTREEGRRYLWHLPSGKRWRSGGVDASDDEIPP